MKNTLKIPAILLLALLLAALSARAQDTINADTSRYWFYRCGDAPVGEYPCYRISFPLNDNAPNVQYLNKYARTDHRQVYGAAFCIHKDPYISYDTCIEDLRIWFCDISEGGSSLQVLYSIPLTQAAMQDGYEHPKYFHAVWDRPEGPLERSDTVVEVAFSEPLNLPPTFFAGLVTQDYTGEYVNGSWIHSQFCNEYTFIYFNVDDVMTRENIQVWTTNYLVDTSHAYTFVGHIVPFFPIMEPIEPDRSECVAPPAPTLLEARADLQRVAFRTAPHPGVGRQQVLFAPWPADPDTLQPASVDHWMHIHEHLDTGRYYAAWQRDECLYRYSYLADTHYWTPWSEPLVVYLGTEPDTTTPPDTTQTESILSPSDSAPDSDPSYYDLLGRRVAHPQPGRLYIHQRRKVIYRE